MTQAVRMTRRMAGMLDARLGEAGLDDVADVRRREGRRWKLGTLLRAVSVGIAAGRKSFSETEALTEEMSAAMGRRLGVRRRVPDTTMRDAVVRVEPDEIRKRLHRQGHVALRRKALGPADFPFGVIAVDGKHTAIDAWDEEYAQRQEEAEGRGAHGVARLLTCCLVSTPAAVCLDAVTVPSATSEMGAFPAAMNALLAEYGTGGLFRLVSVDAGMCSKDNATHVVQTCKRDYLMGLKGPQQELYAEAKRLLARRKAEQADARTEDVVGAHLITRRVYLTRDMEGYHDWHHLRTVLRVESEKTDLRTGQVVAQNEDDVNRYFLCSLPADELTPEQWLRLVRTHWRVENACHYTWDMAFEEDDHPWIVADPKGAVVLMLLRRMVYNALALFRGVTQRSDERRQTPWKTLLRWVYNTLIAATDNDLDGIRTRKAALAGI